MRSVVVEGKMKRCNCYAGYMDISNQMYTNCTVPVYPISFDFNSCIACIKVYVLLGLPYMTGARFLMLWRVSK